MTSFDGHPLVGPPRGRWDSVDDKRSIARYLATPEKYAEGGKAVILLYDLFGFTNDNAKFLADIYAECLGVPICVPDHRPNPMRPPHLKWADPRRNIFRRFLDLVDDFKYMTWFGVNAAKLEAGVYDRVKVAVREMSEEGYTELHIIGFSQGSHLAVQLLADSDPTLAQIRSAALVHPLYPDPDLVRQITKPTCWLIRSLNLQEPGKGELLPILKERQKLLPGSIEVHEFDPSFRVSWGLPFFLIDESDDFTANNEIVPNLNRANEAALLFLRRSLATTRGPSP